MTNPISKMAKKGQENRSPLFLIQDKYSETDMLLIPPPPFFFFPWTQHILKLPVNEGIRATAVAHMPKVNGVAAWSNQMSGRKMDTIVLTWPNTFINNAMPITVGTSLDTCGIGNFIPGIFRTASIISHTNQILICSTHNFWLAILHSSVGGSSKLEIST